MLAGALSATRDRVVDLAGAETLLGVKRVVLGAQNAQIFGSAGAALRQCVFVIQLEEGVSLASPPVGRGEGALQAVASHDLAADLMRNVGATAALSLGGPARRRGALSFCRLFRL